MGDGVAHKSPIRLTAAWVACNALAAVLFLAVASISWTEPELADIPGASGGAPLVWFMTAVPVFLLSVVLNLCAGLWVILRRKRMGVWPVTAYSWLLVAIWLAALFYDGSRHGA
jgi:hypothetical protein